MVWNKETMIQIKIGKDLKGDLKKRVKDEGSDVQKFVSALLGESFGYENLIDAVTILRMNRPK